MHPKYKMANHILDQKTVKIGYHIERSDGLNIRIVQVIEDI